MPKNAKKSLALLFLPKSAMGSQKMPNLRFLALKMPSWQPCFPGRLRGAGGVGQSAAAAAHKASLSLSLPALILAVSAGRKETGGEEREALTV